MAGVAANRRLTAWLMVGVSLVGTACCSTSVMLVQVGIFMKPLAQSFGWSRGQIALALSYGAVTMAVVNPFVGHVIDRFGVRPILITSLLGYGACVAAMPILLHTHGLFGLYFGYALIAGVGAGSNVIAYVRVLSGWFSGTLKGSLGLALGISAIGVPLGGTLGALLAVLLIDRFGWQGGYWGLSLIPLCVGLPVAIFGIRTPPDAAPNAIGAADRAHTPGISLRDALSDRHFWFLIVIVLLMSVCVQGFEIHRVPLFSDLGMGPEGIAITVTAIGLTGIAGRIVIGFMYDRFFPPHVSLVIFGAGAIVLFVLVGVPHLAVAVVAAMTLAVGSGTESDFIGYLVARYWGLRSFGRIFGTVYGTFMAGVALGPYLFGLAFDRWDNYKVPFAFAGVGLTVICVFLATMPRFGEPGDHG